MSDKHLRQIIEALHHVVAVTDEDGAHMFFVNGAYERIWGRSRELLYENPTAFLEGVHPRDRERVRETVIRNAGKEFAVEFRILRPDGDERWMWSRGFPVRDEAGAVYAIASVTEDITERKAVTASHERLLRGFTHDVKNPLGAADGYLSLLELGVHGDMSPAQVQTIRRARRAIGAALALVSQLLDIERAKAGELVVERVPVDPLGIIGECVEDIRPAADAKRQRLILQLPPAHDALVLESDPARVRQILGNLLSNAVKYTQADGHITVSAAIVGAGAAPLPGRCVAVSVADDGPGIALEKRGLLFREFTRLDPAAAEGAGIGLAISQYIAHALAATITVASEPGLGSTFTLWLPAERRAAVDQRPHRIPAEGAVDECHGSTV